MLFSSRQNFSIIFMINNFNYQNILYPTFDFLDLLKNFSKCDAYLPGW